MATVSDSRRLTDLSAAELAAQIAAGEVTSARVVEAFIARIEAVNPAITAVTQPRFHEARAEAAAADAERTTGGELGPLHGVPVTIKDCFAASGTEITLGIPSYSKGPAKADAPLVARLRAAGAIVLGKTNVPQAMLMHECENPVFGRTTHPADAERSPGGSTGGEAALIAAGGSPLGLASDLGGSIRQPAATCGLFGFKPSTGRLTLHGSERALPRGMQAIAIQPGPIARSVADLDLAMRVLSDPSTVPSETDETAGPWPDFRRVDVSQMRIGVWTDDGFFPPAVGLARAVNEAAERLANRGATVVQVRPPRIDSLMRIYLGLISADGMAGVRQLVRGGAIEPQLRRQMLLAGIPRWLRTMLGPLLRLAGQGELADLLRWTGARPARSYWQLSTEADHYRRSFWQDLSRQAEGPVDAVLSPPFGLPALRHGTAVHLLRAASHAFLANLLDAPAGVVPWGTLSEADESAELQQRPAGLSLTQRFARANAVGSAGLPLAVEVMAPAGDDAAALAVMAALEAAR